jgi:PAS domain S-box-containing protein
LVVGLAGSLFVARRILEPVHALSSAAEAWTQGDFDRRVEIHTGDELETLGDTFNEMASSLSSTLSELRTTESQLEDERNRLRAILDTSLAGILVVSTDDRLALINPAARMLLGMSNGDERTTLRDVAANQLFRPNGERYRFDDLPINRSLRDGLTVGSAELLVRRPNGWQSHLLVNSAPIRSTSGRIVGAVAVFVDISPLAEEERLRTEFVTSAAHEFRNPLTVIRGYAEIAMRDPVVQETSVQDELRRILDAASRVERLADQLMRAAQLHLPALILRTEIVDLAELTRSTVSSFADSAEGSKHKFEVATHPACATGDPNLLREALVNMLRQATAVTPPECPVLIAVSAWDGIATVAVTDHGPPVSPDQVESLFVPFEISSGQSVAGPTERPVLFLYLARRIVEESGGWMRARSGSGGTTISFTLPRFQPADRLASNDVTEVTAGDLGTDGLGRES